MMTQLSAKWSSWVGGISALVALVAGVLAFVYLRHFDLTIFVSAALAFASACLSLVVVGLLSCPILCCSPSYTPPQASEWAFSNSISAVVVAAGHSRWF